MNALTFYSTKRQRAINKVRPFRTTYADGKLPDSASKRAELDYKITMDSLENYIASHMDVDTYMQVREEVSTSNFHRFLRIYCKRHLEKFREEFIIPTW